MNSNDELNRIVSIAKKAENELIEKYLENPMLFYTEADLASFFYCSFNRHDEGRTYQDCEGVHHGLVHSEYPTPFRCDMNGHNFSVMGEDQPTKKGGKFKRGHYDLVVLNPDMVRRLPTSAVHGQSLVIVRKEVLPKVLSYGPLIAYGLELQLCRKRLSIEGANRFHKGLVQDNDKLIAGSTKSEGEWKGFIRCENTIGFFWKNEYLNFYKTNMPTISGIRVYSERQTHV